MRKIRFSASSLRRDLKMSATNIPSARRIANIAINDAMILPYDAKANLKRSMPLTAVSRMSNCTSPNARREIGVNKARAVAVWRLGIH